MISAGSRGYLPIVVHPRKTRRRFQALLVLGMLTALVSLTFVVLGRDTWDRVAPGVPSWRSSSPTHFDIKVEGPMDEYGREIVLPKADGRVLVTGGGGMIGKQVVRRLLHAGIATTVLDVIFFEHELQAIRAQYPGADLRFVQGDIRSAEHLAQAMQDVRGVIHLAAVSRVMWCLENEPDCTDINVRGTQGVLEAMPQKAWFIQASSREVYGAPDHIPVAEDTPHSPANVYGKSKAEAENVVAKHMKTAKQSGKQLNAIMVRLSNVYGSEYDHPERLIPAIMRNALSSRPIQMVGGDQDLDMVFVEDVVDGISLAVSRLHKNTFAKFGWFAKYGQLETFNLGTSASTSAMTLIRKAMWLTNSSSPLRIIPGDDRFPSRYVGSTTKSQTVLGYKARVSIDEGLHRLATALLAQTVDFLRAKRHEEPFQCDTPRAYTIDDVLRLDGCRGALSASLQQYHGAAVYANWVGAGKDNTKSWNDTAKLDYLVNAPPWDIHVRKVDDTTAALRLTVEARPGSVRTWLPNELFPGDWEDQAMDTEFTVHVDPPTGYLKLMHDGQPVFPNPDGPEFNWRLTPICCPDKPAPWPFFADDPMASNVGDSRIADRMEFNASQIATVCSTLSAAERYATTRLERMKAAPHPVVLEESPLPTGRAADWRVRVLPEVCRTMCDHPTFCVDTGDCMCGHASNSLSYPPHIAQTPSSPVDGKTVLELQVERSSWANLLSSDARRYLTKKPEWPALTAVRGTDDIEDLKTTNASDFFVLRNDEWGCFSADTVMDRAAHTMSKPFEEGKTSMVFLPFYQFNKFIKFPDIDKALIGGLAQVPESAAPDDVIMPFTHDWSHCNNAWYDITFQRKVYRPVSPEVKRVTSWGPMGDLYSRCYAPDQDVIIPPRTCVQDKLREAFGDIHNVKPARERSGLVGFKGRSQAIYGGAFQREKVMCTRTLSKDAEVRLEGGDRLDTYWQRFKPETDYVQTINETVFCVLPRGTTGWATRMNDVIYGGCIPVLISDRTHHIWWDVLDWSKIGIWIEEWDIERLEEILLGYSWDEVEQMQANLMLVRDAFLYPSEGKMEENFAEKTPWWFAVHSTWLLRQTKYPTVEA